MTNEKLRTGQKVKIMTSSKGLQRGVITGSVRGFGNEQLITVKIGAKEHAVAPGAIITK